MITRFAKDLQRIGPFCLMLAVLMLPGEAGAQILDLRNYDLKVVCDTWEYHLGEKPTSDSIDHSHVAWQELPQQFVLERSRENQLHWLKVQLPDIDINNPVLLIPPTGVSYQIFVDGKSIKKHGRLENAATNKLNAMHFGLIRMPADFKGREMQIGIYAPGVQPLDFETNFVMGSHTEVLRALIDCSLNDLILGAFFMFIGSFVLFLFAKRFHRDPRPYEALAFGVFAVSMGLFQIMIGIQLIHSMDYWLYYGGMLGFFCFPIGLFAFYDSIIGPGYRNFIRRLWQFHIGMAVVAVILDVIGVVFMSSLLYLFFMLLGIEAMLVLIHSFFAHTGSTRNLRIFIFGFSMLILSGIFDILATFMYLPHVGGIFKYGAFCFMALMAYLVERNFAEVTEQLTNYSGELQRTSQELAESHTKLEEYSQSLEQKVEEHTQHLEEKNNELAVTLENLTEMQGQLVIREKMASMGTLLAGVAHEVNSPVGAVSSAADVIQRCLANIREMQGDTDRAYDPPANGKFTRYLNMVKTNNEVIIDAGQRIGRIVKSLKNFARLDEAEFQKTDLHEGLDSTLILVEHLFKNRITVDRQYGELPKIYCYPNQLNQLVMNLFMNASQAIDGKGNITVRTEPAGEGVNIWITDTGKGISDENLDKIFEPGFTTGEAAAGKGLGLSICQNIVSKHCGYIDVESDPGSGSTFHVYLPVKPCP